MNVTKTTLIIMFLASCSAYCGQAPDITPASTQVLGVNKSTAFSCSGGKSDEPDYGAPCPSWNLDADTEVWTWAISGAGNISPEGSEATVTATSTSQDITITVNRNDTYTDSSTGTRPPTSDSGIPSPDSSNVTIVPVELTDPDPSKKWYYFGGLDAPYPADVEMKPFSIVNGQNAPSAFSWSANPNKVAFIAADGASNDEEVVSVALGSNGASDVEITAKWGNNEIGKKNVKIRTFDSIEVNSTWSEWWDFFVSLGYRTHYVWEVADQFGQPIGNVGVNEDLDYPNRQVHVDNNWFNSGVVTRNDETTSAGYFEDQFSVNSILGSRFPEPVDPDWLPIAASIEVVTVPQRYFLGSKASEDGVQMRAHNVIYHRGFATIED